MGKKQNEPIQLSLKASWKVDFQGSRVTDAPGLRGEIISDGPFSSTSGSASLASAFLRDRFSHIAETLGNEAISRFPEPRRDRAGAFLTCLSHSGWKG
jgi:hypothetical protein